jgi:3-oxoacyl-[acyl-carrier-protein] synthase II
MNTYTGTTGTGASFDAAANVVVAGYAVHVPGASSWETGGAAPEGEPMCSAEEAQQVLGRKGLLFKEPATRLAMCAAQRALGLPDGRPTGPIALADRTAVVVSSNLGNLETVCRIAVGVRESDYRVVSPLETPNASSNVIASTLAIRFRATGANFMLCNGATSGTDAIRLGARLIRAGRAEQVIVVGAEPEDEVAQALAKSRDPGTYGDHGIPALRAAAACVVLAKQGGGPSTGRQVLLGPSGVLPPGAERKRVVPPELCGLVHVPYGLTPLPRDRCASFGPQVWVDLTERLGETYGALGVLQAAAAAASLSAADGPLNAYTACGDSVEGYGWQSLYVQDQV